MLSFFLFLFGLIIGSFVAALTYRYPRRISIKKGRSFCPNCKNAIQWFDNIPLLSYFILKGRCRKCNKKISVRYPLIEAVTALAFVLVGPNAFLLFVSALLISILVIDWEHMLIPDKFVFVGIGVAISYLLLFSATFYLNLLVGLVSALVFLLIHLLTFGRGMGLGDVKLALLIGMVVGYDLVAVWLFSSFILGGVVATCLLLTKKAHVGQKVAFGPFLIFGFFVAISLGSKLLYLM